MEKDVDEVGAIAHSVKTKIEELHRANLANRQKQGWGKGSAVDIRLEEVQGLQNKRPPHGSWKPPSYKMLAVLDLDVVNITSCKLIRLLLVQSCVSRAAAQDRIAAKRES